MNLHTLLRGLAVEGGVIGDESNERSKETRGDGCLDLYERMELP
jgi:hypothetical protein